MARINIDLLGNFRVCLEDGYELLFPTKKARMLCAYLALPCGTTHSRERLAALFWGDRADEQARGSLRTALTAIRRLLGADALMIEKDQVALDPAIVTTDVLQLSEHIADGSSEALQAALDLYRGQLLDDAADAGTDIDDWLRRERDRFTEMMMGGFTRLLSQHIEQGSYAAALEAGRTLLTIDPLQEQTHRLMMRLFAEHGQRGLALRQYDDVSRILAQELGIEPDSETRDLAHQIRVETNGRSTGPAASQEEQVASTQLEETDTSPAPPVDRPSIAVLPFATMGHDDHDYFADGIVEEITAALSRVRAFFVIARNSSMTFQGSELPVSKIAERLGVRYLLTGSLRRAGGRLRISTQLLDAVSAEQLWADQFEGGDQDIFDLQDRITEEVVGILQPTIMAAEVKRARRKRPDSLQAYDMVHRAFPHVWAMTFEDNQTALKLLRQAIELDPSYALACALRAWCHAQNITYNWTGDIVLAKERALSRAREAFQLDNSDPLVLTTLATAESLTGDHDIARVHIDRALQIDRNSAWAWMRSGWIHCYDGNFEKSIEDFEHAWRLSPFDPLNFNLCFGIGLSHFALGRDEKAAKLIEQGLLENPGAVWANRPLVAIYASLDQMDNAQAATDRVLARYPDLTIAKIMESIPHRAPVMLERYIAGLRKAGFPE